MLYALGMITEVVHHVPPKPFQNVGYLLASPPPGKTPLISRNSLRCAVLEPLSQVGIFYFFALLDQACRLLPAILGLSLLLNHCMVIVLRTSQHTDGLPPSTLFQAWTTRHW